jgi:hypothetical protein
MIKILALLLLLLPSMSFAATFTSKATGNWSASGQTTWNETGVPGSADTVTIANGHTITVDTNTTVGATVVEGRLTLGASVTLTMNAGNLTIGNGTAKDGQLDFGNASILALDNNHLVLGNCILRGPSTPGTSGANWAKVTGSGNIQTHGTLTSPKQDVVLKYVSFQNTGSIVLALKATTGSVTEQFDVQNCAFSGQSAITFGTASSGTLNITRIFKYNDVDNVGDVLFTGPAGTPSSPLDITGTTFRSATTYNIRVNNLNGTVMPGIVVDNYTLGMASSSTGQNSHVNSFWSLPSGASVNSCIRLQDSYAHDIQNSYFYTESANVHLLSRTGTGSGSTQDISGNVWESIYNTNQSDFVTASPTTGAAITTNLHGNIIIGESALTYSVTSAGLAGTTMNAYNNTLLKTSKNDANYGSLWYNETAGPFPGVLNITNNIVVLASALTPSATDYLTHAFGGINQTIAKAGYNNYYRINGGYDTTTVPITNDQRANDITSDPNFTDVTRSLATWGQTVHGTGGTAQQAKDKLLAINGYNSTTKKQSDTPSGATIYGSSDSLVNWVRAGFAPRNSALKTAGEGGTYIGAMDAAASTSATGGSGPSIMLRML